MRVGLLAALLALALAVVPAADAAPLRVGPGPLLALTAQGTTAYAVIERDADTLPLALVRTSGRSTGRAVPFGEPGAEFPDLAANAGGVVVSWGRKVSGGQIWTAAPAGSLRSPQELGPGTGPGRLALSGSARLIAGPDVAGDAILVSASPAGGPDVQRLTATGPYERHLPMDVATVGGSPLVLDLAQQKRRSVLRVLGERAPRAAVAQAGRVYTYEATLAVSGTTLRVAYMARGRAYLATAPARPDGRWRVRRLGGPGGGEGSAVVAPGGEVLYTQRGEGRHDVYLAAGSRVRRLTRTATDEEGVQLAAGSGKALFAAWTRRDRRARRTDSLVQRIR